MKKEVMKIYNTGTIYPISNSSWVNLVQVVLKKGKMAIVTNANNELTPTRTITE